MTNEEFVEFANPHSWFLVADDLHEQALQLRSVHGNGALTRIDYENAHAISWDSTNRSAFLLGSFALENAIKAFLIYEHPGWISNGSLSRQIRTHNLTKLASKSTIIPYKAQGMKTLRAFEEGNDSWARYPCALHKNESGYPAILDDRLWKKYIWLMSAYGKRLVALLRKRWKGPHGFDGRYNIAGRFLGVEHKQLNTYEPSPSQ